MTALKNRYEELKKQNFPDSERIKFIADLGASEEIEYHYKQIYFCISLICHCIYYLLQR